MKTIAIEVGGVMVLPQERQSEIMKQLREDRSVKISQISKNLNVTRETIRKDIYDMETKGLVRKVHGGAILNKTNLETKYINRKSINEEEKRSIAKSASELVEDGDTLYIDYGTTTLYFVQEILNKKNLTIVTNSLPIANEMIDYSDFEVIIIGGNVRKNEKSLFGPIAYRTIETLYVDKGFFSVSGVDLHAGYTNVHMGESAVSKLMMSHCQKKVMMVDYSKFNTVGMNQVATIDEVDVLITDTKTDKSLIQQLEDSEISIISAEVEGSKYDE